MAKLIDLKRLTRWWKRVVDKYLSSREDALDGLRTIEQIIDKADALVPDYYDARLVRKARDFVNKLKVAAAALPMDDE